MATATKDAPKEAATVAIPPVGTQTLYRLRVREDAHKDFIDVGGQSFAKQTVKVAWGPDGRQVNLPVAGAVTPLYPEQVAAIREAMKRKVVRWGPWFKRKVNETTPEGEIVETVKEFRRGQTIDVSDPRNRRLPTDEPLSDYLFIEETDAIPSAL